MDNLVYFFACPKIFLVVQWLAKLGSVCPKAWKSESCFAIINIRTTCQCHPVHERVANRSMYERCYNDTETQLLLRASSQVPQFKMFGIHWIYYYTMFGTWYKGCDTHFVTILNRGEYPNRRNILIIEWETHRTMRFVMILNDWNRHFIANYQHYWLVFCWCHDFGKLLNYTRTYFYLSIGQLPSYYLSDKNFACPGQSDKHLFRTLLCGIDFCEMRRWSLLPTRSSNL